MNLQEIGGGADQRRRSRSSVSKEIRVGEWHQVQDEEEQDDITSDGGGTHSQFSATTTPKSGLDFVSDFDGSPLNRQHGNKPIIKFSINGENDAAAGDDEDDVPCNKEQVPIFGGSGLKGDNDLAIDKK